MAACEYSLLHVVFRPDAFFFLIAATVCPRTKQQVKEIALAGAGLDEAETKQFPTPTKPFWRFDANNRKPLAASDPANDAPNWREKRSNRGRPMLYLGGTVYRIHGTNAPETIGTHVSSGCIRLTNEDVSDLYSRVNVGTKVIVLPMDRRADNADDKQG
jgi:L,D-transpeptidase catalytic domain